MKLSRVTLLQTGVALLAVGSVAAAAAPLSWHLRGHDRVMPPVAQLRTPVAETSGGVDIGPALALAPFGSANAPPQAQVAAPPVDLVLLGVIVRDDPARSLALISVAGTEANFRLGDALTPEVLLTDVAKDHVTIEIDGVSSILSFAGREIDPEAEAAPTGLERLQALATSGSGMTASERVDAAQRAQPTTTQDFINMWRDRISANPAQVLDTIGLVPTDNGYRIAEKHDVGVNRAGLRAGDLVKSVNGQVVGNVDKDRDLYDVVAESGLARIEVERDGQTIVMSFPLQ